MGNTAEPSTALLYCQNCLAIRPPAYATDKSTIPSLISRHDQTPKTRPPSKPERQESASERVVLARSVCVFLERSVSKTSGHFCGLVKLLISCRATPSHFPASITVARHAVGNHYERALHSYTHICLRLYTAVLFTLVTLSTATAVQAALARTIATSPLRPSRPRRAAAEGAGRRRPAREPTRRTEGRSRPPSRDGG